MFPFSSLPVSALRCLTLLLAFAAANVHRKASTKRLKAAVGCVACAARCAHLPAMYVTHRGGRLYDMISNGALFILVLSLIKPFSSHDALLVLAHRFISHSLAPALFWFFFCFAFLLFFLSFPLFSFLLLLLFFPLASSRLVFFHLFFSCPCPLLSVTLLFSPFIPFILIFLSSPLHFLLLIFLLLFFSFTFLLAHFLFFPSCPFLPLSFSLSCLVYCCPGTRCLGLHRQLHWRPLRGRVCRCLPGADL